MAKTMCQNPYQKEKTSIGTMNECGWVGSLKEMIGLNNTSIALPKNLICQISFLKMTAPP